MSCKAEVVTGCVGVLLNWNLVLDADIFAFSFAQLGLRGDPAVDYDDIDFDVVPPLMQTGTQTLCLLLINLVHFFGLETGQELRVPFDPLAVQQKKVIALKVHRRLTRARTHAFDFFYGSLDFFHSC